jgi:hypothetical protein
MSHSLFSRPNSHHSLFCCRFCFSRSSTSIPRKWTSSFPLTHIPSMILSHSRWRFEIGFCLFRLKHERNRRKTRESKLREREKQERKTSSSSVFFNIWSPALYSESTERERERLSFTYSCFRRRESILRKIAGFFLFSFDFPLLVHASSHSILFLLILSSVLNTYLGKKDMKPSWLYHHVRCIICVFCFGHLLTV